MVSFRLGNVYSVFRFVRAMGRISAYISRARIYTWFRITNVRRINGWYGIVLVTVANCIMVLVNGLRTFLLYTGING